MRHFLLLLCLSGSTVHLPAAEKWADPGLTILDGLEVWLDASRQTEARKGQAARSDQRSKDRYLA